MKIDDPALLSTLHADSDLLKFSEKMLSPHDVRIRCDIFGKRAAGSAPGVRRTAGA